MKQKTGWEIVKEFEQDGVVVAVSMLNLRRIPKFSVLVGFRSEPADTAPLGSCFRFIPIGIAGKGKVRLYRTALDAIGPLVAQAAEWIHREAQSAEDDYIEFKRQKELAQINRGKRKAPMGLKQWAKHDAAKRAAKDKDKDNAEC
jgi:hypothetical protein